jgi:hypothetical protein
MPDKRLEEVQIIILIIWMPNSPVFQNNVNNEICLKVFYALLAMQWTIAGRMTTSPEIHPSFLRKMLGHLSQTFAEGCLLTNL